MIVQHLFLFLFLISQKDTGHLHLSPSIVENSILIYCFNDY